MTCPECGHPPTSSDRSAVVLTLLRRLGRTPRARCSYVQSSVESEVGMPGPCGCRHPFHGS